MSKYVAEPPTQTWECPKGHQHKAPLPTIEWRAHCDKCPRQPKAVRLIPVREKA